MRTRRKNNLILVFVFVWVLLIGGTALVFMSGGTLFFAGGVNAQDGRTQDSRIAETDTGNAGELLAKECIGDVFPVLSRGYRMRTAGSRASSGMRDQTVEMLLGVVDHTLPFLSSSQGNGGSGSGKETVSAGATTEGSLQIAGAAGEAGEALAPAADGKAGTDAASAADAGKTPGGGAGVSDPPAGNTGNDVPLLDTEESRKPTVLIVHTHATESYQPVTDGNFHSTAEEGTVRDVGNVLTEALEAKGIHVIHDKTLHDHPSYNASYGRSLATVKNYLQKNPSIRIVIDLHRDAASYTGNAGKVTTVNGEKVASYSLVVGKGNANLEQLLQFAGRIIEQSDKLYPGMAGRIIEKEYRFNEYVCDQYMLLEVGNNENTIEQVRRTGTYFADVIAAYLTAYGE